MAKQLLYYTGYRRLPFDFQGFPIVHHTFKSVNTGKNITVGECKKARDLETYLNRDIKERQGETRFLTRMYFESIFDLLKLHDILWNINGNVVTPLAESYESIRNEYVRLLNSGENELTASYYLIDAKGKGKIK